MEKQKIYIPPIDLNWSDWFPWSEIKLDARTHRGVNIPNKKSGVYEVKRRDSLKRLTIGRTSNLRMRIRQGLVKGKSPHSTGRAIRKAAPQEQLFVRWAETERPAAAEEELHKQYMNKFGTLPEFTKHT